MDAQIDYRDLWLEASAEVQEVLNELMKELDQPISEQNARRIWTFLPDHIKEQLERDDESSERMELLR